MDLQTTHYSPFSSLSSEFSYEGIIFALPAVVSTMFENQPKCRIWIFQFWHFPPIFDLLKTDLSGNSVRPQALFSKPRQIGQFLAFSNELLSTQNVNVARFARNVEWNFFCDFQTPCISLISRKNNSMNKILLFSFRLLDLLPQPHPPEPHQLKWHKKKFFLLNEPLVLHRHNQDGQIPEE